MPRFKQERIHERSRPEAVSCKVLHHLDHDAPACCIERSGRLICKYDVRIGDERPRVVRGADQLGVTCPGEHTLEERVELRGWPRRRLVRDPEDALAILGADLLLDVRVRAERGRTVLAPQRVDLLEGWHDPRIAAPRANVPIQGQFVDRQRFGVKGAVRAKMA